MMPIPTLCKGQTNPNNHLESHQWGACGLGVNLTVWRMAGKMGMSPKMMVAALTEMLTLLEEQQDSLLSHSPLSFP